MVPTNRTLLAIVETLAIGAPPAPSYPFFDNFVGVDGTLLPAHPPDNGNPWVVPTGGDIQLQSNSAVQVSGSVNIATMDCLLADGTVQATCDCLNAIGLTFRLTDPDNYYYAFVELATLVVVRREAGSETILVSTAVAVTPPQSVDIMVVMLGSTLDVRVDGNPIAFFPSQSFNQTATSHGLYFADDGSSAKPWSFDI
jgi:hypothetical protein